MEYDESTYGERIADVYDELYETLFDTEGAVEFLAALAEGGRALELGIGTGRIALPLKQRGVEVHGIDASEAMVEKLRAKPGGEEISITMGDFAETKAEGEFALVYIPFNTLFALTTREDQVRCFHNAAERLNPEGKFVIEVFVPDPTRFNDHQRVSVERLGDEVVQLETSQHDPINQRVTSYHVFLSDGEPVRLYPVQIRYAWPSELDLMAELAGLRLRERWGSWRRDKFTSESKFHISVYEKPTA
ncbi:MAG: class I SAM-dependent DNA methyltransferase [Actinomycetota bacterium]